MTYAKTYIPCDDCSHSFSKNNQESNMCKICEFKQNLDLINRLQAEVENYKQIAEHQQSVTMDRGFEIKRLKEEVSKQIAEKIIFQNTMYDLKEKLKTAKAEAYKEFAERLKAEYVDFDEAIELILPENLNKVISDLLKELVGEDDK